MTKKEVLDALKAELSGFSQKEQEEHLGFYGEMIDDHIEEGLSEETAVDAIGTPKKIAEQILKETPLFKLSKEKIKPKRRLGAWEIVLLVLGSPVWASLLISVIAVAISLYAVLWSGIVSLWAVFASVVGCAIGGIVGGTVFIFTASAAVGFAVIGGGIFSFGLAIFLFFGCKAATRGAGCFTKRLALWTKRLFLKKEEA